MSLAELLRKTEKDFSEAHKSNNPAANEEKAYERLQKRMLKGLTSEDFALLEKHIKIKPEPK